MSSFPSAMPTPLVSSDWLQQHVADPNLVIIDCRFALGNPDSGRQDYQQGHIPGAQYFDLNRDLSSPVQAHGGRHPLPDLAELTSKLENAGITSRPPTAVVAYDATKGAFAARLWWLLRYLGHDAVAVLDGGFPAWQKADLPIETALSAPRPKGQFIPQARTHWIVDRAAVKQQQQVGAVLIDARSPERYRGEQEPIDPIAGAIPDAANFFWQDNLDETGQFKSLAELQQLWQSVPTGDRSIYYCGSGVTACVNLLAQAMMGHDLPQLYVGGWSDWCSYQ
ncbi:MAG: sulfurtransferase [Leptolyngbyaceae cyanobacterium]